MRPLYSYHSKTFPRHTYLSLHWDCLCGGRPGKPAGVVFVGEGRRRRYKMGEDEEEEVEEGPYLWVEGQTQGKVVRGLHL